MTMKSLWAASAASILLLSTACSAPNEQKADAGSVADNPANSGAAPAPVAAKASNFEEKTDVLEFSYSYPAEVVAIPALASIFEKKQDGSYSEALKAAKDDAAEARANDFPVRAHSFQQKWQKVTQTPRFLSLSSSNDVYTGGAHGMLVYDSLIWDRQANQSLKPLDLFTSTVAFDAAIRKPLCDGIVAAKKNKGIEPELQPDSVFESCPKASEQTIWLGSTDGQLLDRLTIAIGPYILGPYAEGDYHINLKMTPELLRAVKRDYADQFRVAR